MKHDSKLIAAIAAERGRDGRGHLSRGLRVALGPALRAARRDGFRVAELSAAYKLSAPTVYALLRMPCSEAFSKVQIEDSQYAPASTAVHDGASVTVHDSRSGLVIYVPSAELVVTIIKALRSC
jgi:hypothetical protein